MVAIRLGARAGHGRVEVASWLLVCVAGAGAAGLSGCRADPDVAMLAAAPTSERTSMVVTLSHTTPAQVVAAAQDILQESGYLVSTPVLADGRARVVGVPNCHSWGQRVELDASGVDAGDVRLELAGPVVKIQAADGGDAVEVDWGSALVELIRARLERAG